MLFNRIQVWSDLRLRSIKRLSEEFTPKPKRGKYKSKKDKLIEALCSSESIYASYGSNSNQKPFSSPINLEEGSHNEIENSYDNPLAEDVLENTEKHYFNLSNDDNSYDINSFKGEEETDELYNNNNNRSNYSSSSSSPRDIVQAKPRQEKSKYLGQTLSIIDQQMKNQNKIMEHLMEIASNMTMLMENHVKNLEKQNNVFEQQLKATESQNNFLRRQEARRKLLSKFKTNNLQIS